MEGRTESPNVKEFYVVCDMQHRELFSSILYDWQQTGLPQGWKDRDITLCVHSGDRNIRLFRLHPGLGGEPARIIVERGMISRYLSYAQLDALLTAIKAIQGLKWQNINDDFEILEPGNISGPMQQQLRDCIRNFGARLTDSLAP